MAGPGSQPQHDNERSVPSPHDELTLWQHWVPKEIHHPSSSAVEGIDQRCDGHCNDDDDDMSSIGDSSTTSTSNGGKKNAGNHRYSNHAVMAEPTYEDLEDVPGRELQGARTRPTSPTAASGGDGAGGTGHGAADFNRAAASCDPSESSPPTSVARSNDRRCEAAGHGLGDEDRRVDGRYAPSDGALTPEKYLTPDQFRALGIADDDEGPNGEYEEGEPIDDDVGDGFERPIFEVRETKRTCSSYFGLVGAARKEIPTIITVSKSGRTRSLQKQKKMKKKTSLPLHARMEMLHHQTQKPFRTVSKIVNCSARMLHEAIFCSPDLRRLLTMGPSMFQRGTGNKKHLCLNESLGTSSLPGVQHVTSLDSSETGSWDEESEPMSSNSSSHDRIEATGVSRTVKERQVAVQAEAEMDLRWLYARQLLPVAASFQVKVDDGSV